MTETPEVPIDVTTRHGHVTQTQHEYVVRKASKLPRYFKKVTRIEVVVQEGLHEHPVVEMIVHLSVGEPVLAKEDSDHFNQTIDLLIDKAERQLTKLKEKWTDHRAPALKDIPTAEPDVDRDI